MVRTWQQTQAGNSSTSPAHRQGEVKYFEHSVDDTGWQGEGNRSILHRTSVAKTGGRLWTVAVATEWFHLPAIKMALRLTCMAAITPLGSHKTGWSQTAATSSPRISGLPIHSISNLNPRDYHVWGKWWSLTLSCSQSQKTISELKDALQLIWSSAEIQLITLQWKTSLQLCVGHRQRWTFWT